MAPPRASRIESRVSLAADASLYRSDDDSSSDEARRLPPPPPAASKTGTSTGTGTGGSRRSTRLSAESRELDLPAPARSTSTARAALLAPPKSKLAASTTAAAATTTVTASAGNGKRRAATKPRGRAQGDEDDHSGTGLAPATGKRPRVGPAAAATAAITDTKSSTGPVGGAYAPRAAIAPGQGHTKKPPPAYAEHLGGKARVRTGDDDDDDDDEEEDSLRFSRLPPTPKAAPAKPAATAASNKRPPSRARENPKTKISRTTAPDAPIASTSRAAYPPTPPGLDPNNRSVPLILAETPVQVRNIAYRGGTGSAARRASVERRGSRGSVTRASRIGGFDAVPHPEVPHDKLYRSTAGDAPVAVRLRSVLTWTAMRQRDHLYPPPGTAHSSSDAADDSDARRVARTVINQFVLDLGNNTLDVAIQYADAPPQGAGPLPPHPQNVVNNAKFLELQDNYAAIAAEQALRQKVSLKYDAPVARSALPPPVDPATLEFALPGASGPTSLESALQLGRSILAAGGTGGKSKGKAKASPSDAEAQEQIELGLKTAALHRLAHRTGEFTRTAATYVQQRVAQSHSALAADAQRGLDPPADGGLARALLGQSSAPAPGPDARDLLRAIASTDLRGRTGQ